MCYNFREVCQRRTVKHRGELLTLKISTKGRYGLTIMMELATRHGDGPISLKSIAQRHELSEHYLEQLIAPLRNAGLVKSIRGAYGGYVLSKSPDDITSGDILRVLEGPISPVEFAEEEDPAKRYLWLRIRDSITSVIDSTTLRDLINYQDDGRTDNYMFYI
ncbi:HTH-type transcriptional regulator CymR [Brevibacillus laterosporus]|nr:HTH-type transcriptional regulator CymR [Brevibacillus laterosporus]